VVDYVMARELRDESNKHGTTRRTFLGRMVGAVFAAYGGLLRGLPGVGVDVSEAAEMSAELGTTGTMLGGMQLGS
jgi:hypothetical protein